MITTHLKARFLRGSVDPCRGVSTDRSERKNGMKQLVLSVLGLAVLVAGLAGSPASAAAHPATAPDVTCAEISQIPLAECQALAALYNGTGGPQWYDHTGWMATLTPCSWYGVTCQAGRVTQLNLEDNNLSGPLPGQLGNLTQAREISLPLNRLSGSIPTSLSALTLLTMLNLSDNQLTGPIPAQVGGLAALQTLNLADNLLSGPIPQELAALAALQVLNLAANDLTGPVPPWLGGLTNLRELMLTNNQLSGAIPPQLAALSGLQRLILGNNDLSGAIPPELGTLASLRTLVLAGNALSGAIPGQLGNLSELRLLVLSGNRLSETIPATLGNLSNLQELWLNSNALQGAVPDSFCDLTAKFFLDLGYNALASAPACVDQADPFWRQTQTMAPSGLQAAVLSGTTVRLSWSPIQYVSDGGAYEVSYRRSGASWVVAGNTPNKSAVSFTLTGLTPRTAYEFRVRTFTPEHNTPPAFQQNALWSGYVTVSAQTPWSTTRRVNLPLARAR